MPAKYTKNVLVSAPSLNLFEYLLYNFTGAFCVWLKSLTNDFSTEWN